MKANTSKGDSARRPWLLLTILLLVFTVVLAAGCSLDRVIDAVSGAGGDSGAGDSGSDPSSDPSEGLGDYEVPGDPGAARWITPDGDTLDGTIGISASGETLVDWYKFKTTQGASYYIETCNLSAAELGDECDTVLDLFRRPDEESFFFDDDGGSEYLSSAIYWIAPTSDTYYLLVTPQTDNSEWIGTGTYSLGIRTTPPAIPSVEPLALGQERQALLAAPGQHDWYSFSAEAGKEYIAFTYGLGDDCDTVVYLRDSNLIDVGYNDDSSDSGAESLIDFAADYTGTYYFLVMPWGEHIGAYTIQVMEAEG